MITKAEMMDVLLEACPSFTPRWNAFLDEWQDEKNDLPLYLALSKFVRHLIEMEQRGETQGFEAIFQAIERLLLEGDRYVLEAAVIGLLEDLQNPNLHSQTRPEQFYPYLGRDSKRWWDKLQRFWEAGELLE